MFVGPGDSDPAEQHTGGRADDSQQGGQYGKCLVWLESAFHVAYSQYREAAAVVPTRRFKSNSFLLSRKIFHTITGLVVR